MSARRCNRSTYVARRHSAGGFSLLELLVAILILSLLMTASFGSVRIASRSWQAGVIHADATEEMRAVSEFLRRQFMQIPTIVWFDGDRKRIAFEGDRKRLQFIGPAPQHSGGPGLFVYAIAAEVDDTREQLVLYYTAFDPGSAEFGEQDDSRRIVLARDLAAASFDYFGAADDEAEPAWQQRWPADALRLPSLIRLATSAEQLTTGWPELTYAVLAKEIQ